MYLIYDLCMWLGLGPHVELISVVISNFSVDGYQLRHSLGLYNQRERERERERERCARPLFPLEAVDEVARLCV